MESSVHAAEPAKNIDPQKTYEALTILLASYNTKVPAKSSCDGALAPDQSGPARIGNVFAYRLSYLSDGKNVVGGERVQHAWKAQMPDFYGACQW